MSRPRRLRRPAVAVTAVLAIALVASALVALCLGPADITVAQVVGSALARLGWGGEALPPTQDAIVWQLRLPRIVAAALVGAGLAMVGAVMQAVTANPLADPYLLGISSGASLGAVTVIVAGAALAPPLAAFAGAALALVLTLTIGGVTVPTRTILAGVAVSAALSAATSLVIFWSATGDTYREILGWLLGSLAGATWTGVLAAAAALMLVGAALVASASVLDAFGLGDRGARSVGVDVSRARPLLLIACALLTGALVSMSGAIGFVGLVVPHAVRLIAGRAGRVHRTLLPLSALGGALLLLWADTGARVAFEPRELPVGIVTALVGAPVVALLLRRGRVA